MAESKGAPNKAISTASADKPPRHIVNSHMDSSIWNDIKLREGDIIIDTFAKSGTCTKVFTYCSLKS